MGNPVIDRVATADGEDTGPFKTIPTHDQLRSMQRVPPTAASEKVGDNESGSDHTRIRRGWICLPARRV
jgi:hypothetical protein